MKSFKLYHIIIVFICIYSYNTYAQGMLPNIGQYIYINPVNTNVKTTCKGFDCFFDSFFAYKNKKYNFKSKYIYKANGFGLTPYEEIEYKKFYVENIEKIKIKKITYMMIHLVREDKAKIIMRIPFDITKDDNELTRSMVMSYKKGTFEPTYNSIVVPFVPVNALSQLKSLIGKEYSWTGSTVIETGFAKNEYINYYLDDYIEKIIKSLNTKTSTDFTNTFYFTSIRDIKWMNSSMFYFQHLFAECYNSSNSRYFVPVFEHLASNKVFYFPEYITIKEDFKNKIANEECAKKLIDKFVGKKVYYGLSAIPETGYFFNEDLTTTDINKGYYKCTGYDIYTVNGSGKILLLTIEDEMGHTFLSRLEENKKSYLSSRKKDFGDFFMLEMEAEQQFENQRQEEIQRQNQYALWVKKYGKKAADYLKEYEYDLEKFEKCAKKYGVSIALEICEGSVRIGWDKEKCRLSWGEPRDINKSVGSWGVHEQWCYSGSYLYFENGRLTSIQN